jgi:hypothetical protein
MTFGERKRSQMKPSNADWSSRDACPERLLSKPLLRPVQLRMVAWESWQSRNTSFAFEGGSHFLPPRTVFREFDRARLLQCGALSG